MSENICPNCNESLDEQYSFSPYFEDYTCENCGAELHRDSIFEDYSLVENSDNLDNTSNAEVAGIIGALLGLGIGLFIASANKPKPPPPQPLPPPKPLPPQKTLPPPNPNPTYIYNQYHIYNTPPPNANRNSPTLNMPKKSANSPDFFEEIFDFLGDHWIATTLSIVCITTVIIGTLGLMVYKSNKIEQSKLTPIGVDSSSLISIDYLDAKNTIEKAGFTNVYTQPINDLDINHIKFENTVKSITVNGVNHFESKDRFPYDTKIIITYHIIKEINLPISSRKATEKNYEDLNKMLENAGFVNITLKPEYDLITGWITKDGSVESVTINGDDSFSTLDSYRPDAEIIIVYHTFKK